MRQPSDDPRKESIRARLTFAEQKCFDAMLARDVVEVRRCFHLTALGAARVLNAVRDVEAGEKS
jgi:hypothetical protein